MNHQLAHVALLVRDYDEAIAFYTKKLSFQLIEDTHLFETKRWVLLAPAGANQPTLLLAKSANDVQDACVGNQTGGRVFLFLYTDDLQRDYQNLKQHQIQIVREPKHEAYGIVLVFADLYGNLWDLIQPAAVQSCVTSTAILNTTEKAKPAQVVLALQELRTHTLQEQGVIQFVIKQALDNPNVFVVWERFESQAAFEAHLNSAHLQHFLSQELVTLERAIQTQDLP